jgi:Protein of unknown function (DUF3040)
VPLSEHEQRLLSQMEEQLLADDPRFASTMRGSVRRAGAGRRMLIGAIGLVVGLLLLVMAVAYKIIPLGIAAFVLMLAGAGYAFSPPRRASGPIGVVDAEGGTRPARGQRRRGHGHGTLMQRFEQRWQQRRDER